MAEKETTLMLSSKYRSYTKFETDASLQHGMPGNIDLFSQYTNTVRSHSDMCNYLH